jgi:hypothetical protein
MTNDNHCGGCGIDCASTFDCISGACACPPGETRCGSRCRNLETSFYNCGSCGHSCWWGQRCRGGDCEW